MTRSRMISLLAALSLAALIAWVANNTYWGDTKVPMPLKGEALTNPFYAVQRFAEALGARTAWDRVLITPPADSVIVLSAWNWNLTTGRREAFERWVESGGRLVIDQTLVGGEEEFERWSGIVREYREPERGRRVCGFEVRDRAAGSRNTRMGSRPARRPRSSVGCAASTACLR